MERIDPDSLFIEMAQLVAQRGTCPRAQVGAVIVRDRRVISMGYNGAPPGMPHCEESAWCVDTGCENAIHAEANAIAWAARHGIPTDEATLYGTHLMCVKCAELVVSAGIAYVYYLNDYRVKDGLQLLKNAGIGVAQWSS